MTGRKAAAVGLFVAVTTAGVLYFAGYPWTTRECYAWAASRPTDAGVNLAYQMCKERHPVQ